MKNLLLKYISLSKMVTKTQKAIKMKEYLMISCKKRNKKKM